MLRFSICSFLIFLGLPASEIAAQGTFVQDRFAIGIWVDPPLDSRADERYQELANANFSFVIGGFGRGNLEEQIALCKKYDLKLIVSARQGEITNLPSDPIICYALRDEPNAADFPALRERADQLHKSLPGKLAYINLFPNYASPEQLGTDTYDEHVGLFIKTVRPGVLSMDHYPRFYPGGDGREAYCENLSIMRKHSLDADIPFWNFFNTMPYGPHTDPTEAQLRGQINTSLAYGAKGLMYFCYFTPNGDEFPKGGAIIRRDGSKTRHYDEATRINKRLENLGPILMKLTSTKIVHIDEAKGTIPKKKLAGLPITNLARDNVDPKLDYLVAAFTHQDGRRAVLLTNYRFAYSAWPTVTFDTPIQQITEIDPATGKEISVRDDSPSIEGIQLSLGAADARLFLLP